MSFVGYFVGINLDEARLELLNRFLFLILVGQSTSCSDRLYCLYVRKNYFQNVEPFF